MLLKFLYTSAIALVMSYLESESVNGQQYRSQSRGYRNPGSGIGMHVSTLIVLGSNTP